MPIDFFKGEKGGREREERNIVYLPLICAPTGDQTRNLGTRPDQESKLQPFGLQDNAPISSATLARSEHNLKYACLAK